MKPTLKAEKPKQPKKPWVWVEQREVISAMRARFRKYPPYKEVLARTRIETYRLCKNGNKQLRVFHQCETCPAQVPKKQYKVDHIDPVVDPRIGFVDYNVYAFRLYCPLANLQGLCKPCHDAKCKVETKIRTLTRKEQKNERS